VEQLTRLVDLHVIPFWYPVSRLKSSASTGRERAAEAAAGLMYIERLGSSSPGESDGGADRSKLLSAHVV
jgi:hypothetical protein